MPTLWICSNLNCEFSLRASFSRYCSWCGRDMEPAHEPFGGSLAVEEKCRKSNDPGSPRPGVTTLARFRPSDRSDERKGDQT